MPCFIKAALTSRNTPCMIAFLDQAFLSRCTIYSTCCTDTDTDTDMIIHSWCLLELPIASLKVLPGKLHLFGKYFIPVFFDNCFTKTFTMNFRKEYREKDEGGENLPRRHQHFRHCQKPKHYSEGKCVFVTKGILQKP